MVSTIQQIYPPYPLGGEDEVTWSLTSNGRCSVSSAYDIVRSNQMQTYSKIWGNGVEIQGPQRLRSFLWLVAHESLMTNAFRVRKHLTHNNSCPRCVSHGESCLHALRDCGVIEDMWKSIVFQHDHQQFFCLGLQEWLMVNLQNHLWYIPWSLLFSTATWTI